MRQAPPPSSRFRKERLTALAETAKSALEDYLAGLQSGLVSFADARPCSALAGDFRAAGARRATSPREPDQAYITEIRMNPTSATSWTGPGASPTTASTARSIRSCAAMSPTPVSAT
ncbi:MAG: hypothetical protein HPM95_19510 [Alphaproteobacteria bacterium]|nr:hypothetical protein [Alphaproteobacteria bacterium]